MQNECDAVCTDWHVIKNDPTPGLHSLGIIKEQVELKQLYILTYLERIIKT